jgi:hypothetical protein
MTFNLALNEMNTAAHPPDLPDLAPSGFSFRPFEKKSDGIWLISVMSEKQQRRD